MTLSFEGVRVPLAEFDLRLDVTLEGPVTAIVGPSGAGKTSLLEVVAGLRPLAAGRVLLGGTPLVDVGTSFRLPERLRGIGYLTQDDTLFPHLSVEHNLVYGAPAHERKRLDTVVAALGIRLLLRRSTRELSGGERRRVALGRALLAAPRLLMVDEPLTALNQELRAAVGAMLVRLKAEVGTPMLYVTHLPAEATGLADEVIELREGAVVRHQRLSAGRAVCGDCSEDPRALPRGGSERGEVRPASCPAPRDWLAKGLREGHPFDAEEQTQKPKAC